MFTIENSNNPIKFTVKDKKPTFDEALELYKRVWRPKPFDSTRIIWNDKYEDEIKQFI